MKESQPKWYPHFCNTQDNLEFMELMEEFHGEAFAVFYIVKEKLMISETGALPFDRLVNLLQRNFYCCWEHPEKLQETIRRCITLKLLYKDKGGLIRSKEVDERRGLIEKKIKDGAKGGNTSAENRAGGYNEYRFILRDGTTWRLPNRVLNKWREMFQDCDVMLKELQTIYENDEKQRDTIDQIEKHIEAYLIQNAIPF